MLLITRKSLASTAAKRWKEQYPMLPQLPRINTGEVLRKLESLGPTPNPDDVDAVIGNGSWTATPECSECGSGTHVVVRVGEEPDYESRTAWLCRSCVAAALTMFENNGVKQGQ